jgi:glycosyltransferase 2 family protein
MWRINYSFNGFFKKKIIYLKFIATAIILWLLVHNSQLNIGFFTAIIDKPLLAFSVIALFYVSVLINSWRWYRLNAVQGLQLSYFHTITPTYLGVAFNNVLPGSVGGDFVRLYYILKKFPDKKSGAIFSVMFDRLCGLMAMFVIASLIALFRFSTFSHQSTLFYLLIVCFSCCIAGVSFFILSILLPEKLGLSDWLNRKFVNKRWLQPIISMLNAIHIYRNAKGIIFECLGVSIISQILLLIVILLINRMLGLPPLSPLDYAIALVVGQIANLIPLTPGGLGIGEAVFGNILLLLNPGIVGAYATVFFAFRLLITLAYLPGVIIGIVGLDLLHKEKLVLAKSNIN